MLLREVDRCAGLTERVAHKLEDSRQARRCEHSLLSIVRQRVYGLALGYEDQNDHTHLRHDVALQAAVGRESVLASQSTINRLENSQDRRMAWALHEVLFDQFVASFGKAPRELILDFDATDDPVHGQQEGRFFHGYYDRYCFLPLYVFCGSQLLVAYLRPSKIDGAKHAWAILALLVKRLRQTWPGVRIVFRGDSGFCRHRMLSWCERHDVNYVVGVAQNARLLKQAEPFLEKARGQFEATQEKVRFFDEVNYAARSWRAERRVIVKAEHAARGPNPRFVVTNLSGDAADLYEKLYCARGDMENRIKEQQLDLFADRTSAHEWWANQFRLLLSSLAYVLLETLRRVALAGTELARAQCGTIRLKLLKIGGVVVANTRRVRLMLSSAYPYKDVFRWAAARLCAG